MKWGRERRARWLIPFAGTATLLVAQTAPPSPDRPWHSGAERQIESSLSSLGQRQVGLDLNRVHSLSELVAFAEAHNPETSAAWENARAQASAAGIARSELYPQLAAIAYAAVNRAEIPSGERFYRQTVPGFDASLDLTYLIFDFGGRRARIDQSLARLLAANFAFNDFHRTLIFRVEQTYFRLLNAFGQETAARASLANAESVQQAAELRLQNGLATLPDVLESRSATAQAEYDLQSILGVKEIAQGTLATSLGLSASVVIPIQPLDQLSIPGSIGETAEQAINRALTRRPDLQAKLVAIREASAREKEFRAAYYPTLGATASTNAQSLFLHQQDLPWGHTTDLTGGFELSLKWTVFDGGNRKNRLSEASAELRRAQAELSAGHDDIENQVWEAYSFLQTAFRQREAAAALLTAASQSYSAALESYNYGVRSLLDVTAAQKVLSQARSADVSARAEVLAALSNLAFRTADSIGATPSNRP
jgi:outer membrane protein